MVEEKQTIGFASSPPPFRGAALVDLTVDGTRWCLSCKREEAACCCPVDVDRPNH
jgi:hypothetical protein